MAHWHWGLSRTTTSGYIPTALYGAAHKYSMATMVWDIGFDLKQGYGLYLGRALEINTIDYQTGKPLQMPVKNEWTNWMPDNAFDGLHGGLDYNDDYRSDGSYVYISQRLLNMMDDDTVLSFKFWPRNQEVNVDVVVHVR